MSPLEYMRGANRSFDERKKALIQKAVDEHIKKMEAIEGHKEEDCKAGKHLLDGHATGGRSGHYFSFCLLCNYTAHGYD